MINKWNQFLINAAMMSIWYLVQKY